MSGLGDILQEQEKALIEIPIYYRVKENSYGNKYVEILSNEDGQEALNQVGTSESDEVNVEVLNTKWHRPTWKMQNEILSKCTTVDNETGQANIDVQKFRDLKVKTYLRDWDMEYDGQQIPVSEEVIDRLPPDFFISLADKFDLATTEDEEHRGK